VTPGELVLIIASCIAAGAVAGYFAGMIGIGGGFTTVPVLNYLLPIAAVPSASIMHVALATSLALMVVNTASAAWHRWRARSLTPSLLARLAGPVAAGAILGVVFADGLPDWVLRAGFIAFIAIAIYRGLRRLRRHTAPPPTVRPTEGRLPRAWIWAPYFVLVGTVGAMAGGGAATLTVPFCVARRYSMQEAAGQAAALSAVIGLAGAASFALIADPPAAMPPFSLGYLYLPALAGLLAGGQVGVRRGVTDARRLSDRRLRQIFLGLLSVVLLAMSAKLAGL